MYFYNYLYPLSICVIAIEKVWSFLTIFHPIRDQKSKSDREGEITYDIPYMWNLKRNDTNELTCKTERDSQTQ